MSILWMTRVFESSEPQGTERLMLLALADNANDQGVCWPSMRHLASKCALGGVRAARKVVARLEAEGFVRREEVPGKVTRYHLLSTRLCTSGHTPERPGRGKRQPRNGGTGVKGRDPGTVGPGTPEQRDRGPRNGGTSEPSMNHQEKQQHAHTRTRAKGPKPLADVVDATAAGLKENVLVVNDAMTLLLERGVDEAVAVRLAGAWPERVAALCERFDAEGGHGPGWLVRAIEDGWAARTGAKKGRGLLTYREMLDVCDRTGASTDEFEAVPQVAGKPLWRRKQ